MDWDSFKSGFSLGEAPPEPKDSTPKAEGDVALFLDWDSLRRGLVPHKVAPNIALLLQTVNRYGKRGTARAYADWNSKNYQNDGMKLVMQGIETLSVESDKNPQASPHSDVRLAVEATDLCYTNPHLHTFVLVSGNGGIIHVVDVLKRNGRKVIVIGMTTSLSGSLRDKADEVILYDQDIVALVKGEVQGSASSDLERAFGFAEDLLRQAKGKPIPLAKMENFLQHMYNLNVDSLGMNFNSFIKKMMDAGRIKVSKAANNTFYAFLAEGAAVKRDETVIAGLPQEINWVISVLGDKGKPQAWGLILQELKTRYGYTPDREFQGKVTDAQKSGWLNVARSKRDNQVYIALGDRVP